MGVQADIVFRRWLIAIRLIPWIWGIALAVTLTGGMTLADFCIVDDHHEALWLGGSDGFPFSGIWPALLKTEVGHLGSGGRFRPIYFLYLEFEAWLFGDRPGIYHALRVLYFGLFLGSAGQIAARCIGLLPALALTAGIAGLNFWSNLWTLSLGPAEQLATLGISIFVISCGTIVPRIVLGQCIPLWALPLASLGIAVAVGSKENFVYLLAILGPLMLTMAVTRRLQAISAVLALPALVVPGLVLYAVGSAAGSSQDFYGFDNSIIHRLTELLMSSFFALFAFAAVVLAVPLSLLVHRRSSLTRPQRWRATIVFLGFTILLAVYILWEIFFYNGRLPSGIRYDFPILLLPLCIALGFAAYIRYTLIQGGGWRWRYFQLAFVLLAALYLYPFEAPFSLRVAVNAAVARTTAFRHDFGALRTKASEHPDWPIILEPNSPWDYEVIDSFKVWAKFFQVTNPLLLRVQIAPKDINGQFEQSLTGQMQRWGTAGTPGKFGALPDPLMLFSLNKRCFGIGFWQPIVSPCMPLVFQPDRYIPHG